MAFFAETATQAVLRESITTVASAQISAEFEQQRNAYLLNILDSMLKAAAEWDESCSINIGWVGNSFVSRLINLSVKSPKESFDEAYALAFRFLLELYLSTKNELNHDLEPARVFAVRELNSFESAARAHIEYAWRDMPISILKSLINGEQYQTLKDFSKTVTYALEQKAAWNKELEERENRVKQLKENLEQYESAFNFVGLHQGFEDLSVAKSKEKSNIKFWLNFLGVLITVPLLVEGVIIWAHIQNIDKLRNALLISVVPTVSLAAILIFYFRVLLQNFNSTKSQILQIELRKTLCRFIQSYVVYAEKMSEKNQSSLGKFENIIFSSLASSDDKLPSTFDGLEKISDIVKAIRK
jgi:hypothetical protein